MVQSEKYLNSSCALQKVDNFALNKTSFLKPKTEEIFIRGPVGRLQGCLTVQDPRKVAIVFPPHPKHLANMNNKVVIGVYESFVANNFSVLRTNSRGVGSSTGVLSKKDDEIVKDGMAAVDWLQNYFPDPGEFWVAGFSFGSWMAMNIGMRRPEVTGFIVVSPPNKTHDMSFMAPCTIPGLIIQGTEDKLSDSIEMLKLVNASRSNRIEHTKIEGADYKYNDPAHLNAIRTHCTRYINRVLSPSPYSLEVMDQFA